MRHKLLTIMVTMAVLLLRGAVGDEAISVYAADKGKGPVLHMRFDEGGGPTAYDEGWTDTDSDGIKDSGESWNNYDGTLTPGATGTNTAAGQMWSTQGKISGALELDGTDDFVNCGNNASLDITGDMTIEMWIKPNTLPTSTNIGFIAKRALGGGAARWHFGINNDLSGYNFYNGTVEYQSSQRPSVGVWSHITMVLNSGTNVKYYTNGVLVDTIAGASIGTLTGDPVTIGKSGVDILFDGLIDDLRIYDYARTAAQIAVDYNAGAASHLSAGTDPNEGNPPVAYWKFDENTGTTAYDRSGSGYNGTITNATWAQGKYGSALNFDGSGDYVSVASSAGSMGTGDWSINFWWKSNGTQDAYATIIGQGFTGSPSSGAWAFKVQNGTSASVISFTYCTPSIVNNDSSVNPNDRSWHNIAGVRTGTSLYLYMDNVLIKTITLPANFSFGTGETTYIGYNPRDSDYVNGLIDQVRIYNYARTVAQIAYDYNKGAPVAHWRFDEGTGAIAHNSESSAHSGAAPIGWWRMDEGTGGTTADASGNGNTGTLNAGAAGTNTTTAAMWDQTGKIGPDCVEFDGTDDQVSMSHNLGLEPASLTIQFWMNLTNQSKRHCLITKWSGYTTEVNADGTFKFGLNGCSSQYFGSKVISWGTWYHVACTFDNSTKLQSIYLNGVLQESQTVTGSIDYSQASLYFSGSWDRAKGLLDDVRIYSYARTAEQIYNDYRSTHGTMVGDTKFVDGKIGKALQFNGTSDYVAVNNPPTIGTSGITVSAWVYYNVAPTTGWQYAIATQDDSSTRVFQLSTYNKRFMWHRFGAGDVVDDTDIVAQRWYHVAATFDGTNHKLYIDGALKDQEAGSLISSSTVPVEIGRKGSGEAWSYFNGKIDDVRIYNYARTAAQIAEDYADGAARLGAQTAGIADPWGGALPVGHWKLDENTGVLARDASEGNNDGTITGAIWTQGKNGPCLSFDGDEDKVIVTSSTDFDFGTNNYSVFAWIKGTGTSDYRAIVYRYTGPGFCLLTMTGNGYIRTWINDAQLNGTTNILDNNWHNVGAVRNGDTLTVYVDGVAENSLSGVSAKNATASGTDVSIGINGSSYDFNGSIDDVRIYNYALTQAQVAWLYNSGKPVGYWRMDEASGTDAFDDTGNNNGTVTIGATGTQTTIAAARTAGATGKFGRCLSLDGTDDVVSLGTSSTLKPQDGTYEAWIKLNALPTDTNVGGVIFVNYSLEYSGLFLSVHHTGKLHCRPHNGVTSQGWDSSGTLTVGQWYHVVGVINGSNGYTYINGVQDGSRTDLNYKKAVAGNQVYIGSWGSGSMPFPGQIDDVRIYNYARTQDQIMQDYNNGAASKLSD